MIANKRHEYGTLYHTVTTMAGRLKAKIFVLVLVSAVMILPGQVAADSVAVGFQEGLVHGFLTLRTSNASIIAVGDLMQTAKGERVTSNLIFHFKDGSVHDETTVFTQHGKFQLLSNHVVEKGPAFKRPMETSLDVSAGQFTVHYQDDDGKDKVLTEHLEIPADVANGMVPMLLKNLQSAGTPTALSMVVATPKPRIVKLAITSQGEESVLIGGVSRKASHFVVKVELGGVAGVVAPIVGKQPVDTQIWILGGGFPVFVRSEGQMFEGGPVWTIEQTSPVWPQKPKGDASKK
jgi:hypothetical protein